MKKQKKDEVFSDLSKLSNIIDDNSNKNIQSSVEDWFSGGKKSSKSDSVKSEPEKKAEGPKTTAPVTKVAAPETPVGDCSVCVCSLLLVVVSAR